MVQVIRRTPQMPKQRKSSFSELLGLNEILSSFGGGISKGLQERENEKKNKNIIEKEDQLFEELTGMELPQDPEARKQVMIEAFKGKLKNKNQFDLLNQLGIGDKLSKKGQDLRGEIPERTSRIDQLQGEPSENEEEEREINVGIPKLPHDQEDILKMSFVNPSLANQMQKQNDEVSEEARHREKMLAKNEELKRKEFLQEREYHSKFTGKLEEEANSLRSSIPRKEMALNASRHSLETGDLEYFSKDKLADLTGIDALRTTKGAELITASKENLLSNMSRVSSRAQNKWFEQRLNSMFPKIGQSKEANLTIQEMIEGELALDRAYLELYDITAEQDEKNFGFVRKDISRRVHQAMKPYEDKIFQRTNYRMRQLEESEKGYDNLKKSIGKNVSKGTPLTLEMTKLYINKFGENAKKVAEKNGYYIPTYEEYQEMAQSPQEFRSELINE